MKRLLIGLVLLGCGDRAVDSSDSPSSLAAGFVKTRFAGGLNNPAAMAIAPDGRIFVALRGTNNGGGTATGQVRIVKNGALLATPFATVTVDNASFGCCNERGLVGIALDPQFADNKFVYVYYTVPGNPAHNRVSRFTAIGDVAQGGETVMLDLDGLSAPNHNGGGMHFGTDGKLYIAVGNNVVNANSQSIANRHGKLLRINRDGSIPNDNPTAFMGVAGAPSGANRAIWALGFRNPFTFAVNPATGRIFVNDVGENSREEIDQLERGQNYGWPSQEGIAGPDNPSFTRPVWDYGHGDQGACAITGGAFYHPATNTFGSSYLDNYFFADYCGGWIRMLDPSTKTVTGFDAGLSQPIDLAVGGDGALYVLATGSGEIWRIQAKQGAQDIQVSTGSLVVDEGTSETFTVQLAAQPPSNLAVAVAVREGDPSITVSPASLTFTPASWNVPQTVTVAAGIDPAQGVSVGAAISCRSPGLPTHEVIVLARDASPTGPSAEISLPHAGDTIQGKTVDFFGQNDGPATTTKGEFYIDGVLAYTDVVTAPPGHYHYLGSHQSLDSTLLSQGRHTLALKVIAADGTANTHQIMVDVKNGIRIVNAKSGKCVDVAGGGTADGTNIQQWTCTGGDAQRFELIPDGTRIRIRNSGSGKCVDIAGGSTADGTNIQLWTCNGTGAQLFERVDSSGHTTFRNPQSGKCIDVDNAGTADGTNIKLWPCNGTLAQAFDVQ